MHYYATAYTIHFDDTMAYGSHHFLTSFKFQCFSRESFLYGDLVYDVAGVREALDSVHLLTAEAYARNLNPAMLGDRVAILLTIENWERASARFCYRVIGANGTPICAGFQTLICADARTGRPTPWPAPLWNALEKLRSIEAPRDSGSFREKTLAGGSKTESLFGDVERNTAVQYLQERYPSPKVIPAVQPATVEPNHDAAETNSSDSPEAGQFEAWVFAGQGAFDPELLSKRIAAYAQASPNARRTLDQCAAIAQELVGGDAYAIVSGKRDACAAAVEATPGLAQIAIHLQNVLGAYLRQADGITPGVFMGHSFGEIAAFGAAGCFDLPTGIRIVCERVRAIADYAPPDGSLLAVMADRATVMAETALNDIGDVLVAGRNHEEQTVVSGPGGSLERLRDCLQKKQIKSVAIPTPTSFHHPALRRSASAWLEHLKTLPIKGPSGTLYSPIGRRYITPDDDIPTVLASQLVRPFDFQGGISDVLDAGVTRFVDCGSAGSLARIITKAGDEGLEVLCLGMFGDKKPAPTLSSAQPVTAGRKNSQDQSPPQAPISDVFSIEEPSRESHALPRIAIVGQGCILPAGANSSEQLLAAITEQRNGIFDQRRFDPHWEEDFYSAKLVPDRSTSFLGGTIENHEIVAPAGVDQEVFNRFSRAQRLLCIALMPSLASLKDAKRIMCIIGATADGFEDQDAVSALRCAGIDPADPGVDERVNTARSAFQEPYDAVREVLDRIVRPGLEIILVDAACASSLYSVALGVHALEENRVDAVIAGGVFCPGPGTGCLFSQFRASTATGCRPFDANANGVVFSEGSAVITLRRVADAELLGLPVEAVVRGVGLSSDGRSPAANVPQTRGQLLALERCYRYYDIDPASVQAIEGHGTSTPVGDSTEVETLRQFFSGRVQQPIMLHSLKGLLGHAGWAAGTASIIAACQYLRHNIFPAQANHQEPSKALAKASGTLNILKQTRSLSSPLTRIAVDGFGFGGSNAHIVLDSYAGPTQGRPQSRSVMTPSQEDELVFVAAHEVAPTLATKNGMRFDREGVSLPKRHILLPDLVDDMDISQKLAVVAVDEVLGKLPRFDEALQRETSVLLAQSGKTERGVGATLRVLDARLYRKFAGNDRIIDSVKAARDAIRPSGPYTLQCMMPNVASGRAALQMDLHGPNFVVDAGTSSLEAAASAASLLLHAGDRSRTKLVVLAAIHANPWRVPLAGSSSPEEEYAAAFAITTRRYAEEFGLNVLAPMKAVLGTSCSYDASQKTTTAEKVRKLSAQLQAAANPEPKKAAKSETAWPKAAEYRTHAPVWIEAPAALRPQGSTNGHETALVAIVPAHQDYIAQIVKTLPTHVQRCRFVVVGDKAREVASNLHDSQVIAADFADENSVNAALAEIERFEPNAILAIESMTSWDRAESLAKLATDNSLCEMLFLIAQRNVSRLTQGKLDLWGLFHDAWNGAVHPASGPIAGLLKSIAREIAGARVGIVCTRGHTPDDAVKCLLAERSQRNHELEVVFDGATRLVRRLREVNLDGKASGKIELNAQSVVIASGGARGVTAVLLDALLRDYHCTVVALGRSSIEAGPADADDPQVERDFYAKYMREHPRSSAAEMKRAFEKTRACWETHQTIQQLSTLGGRVEYMVADVTDREQVAKAVGQIVTKYGRIDLLVHGAGVQTSTRLENRRLADFRRTFSVKVRGLHHLTDECRIQLGKTVPTHVLTSAYSIFGNDGQHDYGAANETMDRLCGMSGLVRWSSIAWLAWDGIGMTRGSEYYALSKRRGLSGLTVEDGQRIFRNVITGQTHADINVPLSASEHARYEVPTIPPLNGVADGRVFERRVDLSKIDFLSHHVVRGVPTLPGAWILDLMVTTGSELLDGINGADFVTIQNANFHRFVRHTGNERNLRVVAQSAGDQIAVWMIGDICHPTGPVLTKDVVFAHAVLSFKHASHEMPRPVQGSNGHNGPHLADPYCAEQREDILLSGPFDCLCDIAIGPAGRRARFNPSRFPIASNSIPALLLDAALRVGAMYAVQDNSDLYVPVRIGRLIVPIGSNGKAFSALPREIRATAPRLENGHVHCDQSEVLDESGAVRLVVQGAYAMRLG